MCPFGHVHVAMVTGVCHVHHPLHAPSVAGKRGEDGNVDVEEDAGDSRRSEDSDGATDGEEGVNGSLCTALSLPSVHHHVIAISPSPCQTGSVI